MVGTCATWQVDKAYWMSNNLSFMFNPPWLDIYQFCFDIYLQFW